MNTKTHKAKSKAADPGGGLERKYWCQTLKMRHPNNPTWLTLVDNMLKDEPKLLLKIAKDPIITQQLEEDWKHTRSQLRNIMHSDIGSVGMATKGKGSL